ncbi:A/G-specific adenine glycosylase [Leucobacter albus]|uniref:Adenine DNA glycosylase n=1 Tax=Leucobacter albus TaxID=272210 RepID=A0ABW3TPT4_9MICO
METTGAPAPPRSELSAALNAWFELSARELPWRAPDTTAWGVLVSEFMSQQTQVERVIPHWLEWMERWPTPSALAAAEPGEAVRAWKRLGYPRRALWLHRAAVEIAERHGDKVPADVDALLALTGIGPYTARAVAVFAFGDTHPVVDTNTRRVIARAVQGRAAAGMPAARDLTDMAALLPSDRAAAATFNAAAMELGAIVCTARAPRCDACPIANICEWRGAGYPDNAPEKRPKQAAFEGSDRQARGKIMELLRSADAPVAVADAVAAARAGRRPRGAPDPAQPRRAYDSLVADGLLVEFEGLVRLP